MPKTVFALHTGFALVEPLKPLFQELMPEVRVVNVVDDSLLADVRAAGCVTPQVIQRIAGYGVLAQASGADAIFSCCSSVGEATDVLARLVHIPVVKIDGRMAGEAVRQGSRIAVVATVSTTLDPTSKLIEQKAAEADKAIVIRRYLAEGAFDALMNGSPEEHDRLLLECIVRAASENDVVALAQGSMARLVPVLAGRISVPVLATPRSGVEALRDALIGD